MKKITIILILVSSYLLQSGCKPDELKPQNNPTNPTETTVTLTDSSGNNQIDINNPIAQVKINIQAGSDAKIVTFKISRKIGNDPSEILVNNNNIDTVKDFKLVSSFYDSFIGKTLISGDVITYTTTVLDSKNKIVFASLSYTCFEKEEIFKTTKKALFLYYTGSECNPCGTYGIPNYKAIINDLNLRDKVISLAVHCNVPSPDALYDPTAGKELLDLIITNNSYSAPTFLIPPNAPSSGSASDAVLKYSNYINTFSVTAPSAAINVSITNVDGVYQLKTKTKFFNNDNSTYKISALILEDGVLFHQIANGVKVEPYTHNQVLRGKFTTSALGDVIRIGSVTSGEIIEKTFLGVLDQSKNWNINNLSMVVVLWKQTVSGSVTTLEVMNSEKIKFPQ